MIVDLGVFELGEIERRGVLHEPHAQPVGEQVAEQALEQGREARQPFAHHRDAELQPNKPSEMPPVGRAAAVNSGDARDDAIDDELADPENRDGNEGSDRPQHQDRDGVAPVGLKH